MPAPSADTFPSKRITPVTVLGIPTIAVLIALMAGSMITGGAGAAGTSSLSSASGTLRAAATSAAPGDLSSYGGGSVSASSPGASVPAAADAATRPAYVPGTLLVGSGSAVPVPQSSLDASARSTVGSGSAGSVRSISPGTEPRSSMVASSPAHSAPVTEVLPAIDGAGSTSGLSIAPQASSAAAEIVQPTDVPASSPSASSSITLEPRTQKTLPRDQLGAASDLTGGASPSTLTANQIATALATGIPVPGASTLGSTADNPLPHTNDLTYRPPAGDPMSSAYYGLNVYPSSAPPPAGWAPLVTDGYQTLPLSAAPYGYGPGNPFYGNGSAPYIDANPNDGTRDPITGQVWYPSTQAGPASSPGWKITGAFGG